MTEQAERLLTEALKLSTSERARLAAELLASVDGPADEDAEVAWAREIDRRVRDLEASGPRGEEWSVVHARIAKRLNEK